jgi:hypothetical protein
MDSASEVVGRPIRRLSSRPSLNSAPRAAPAVPAGQAVGQDRQGGRSCAGWPRSPPRAGRGRGWPCRSGGRSRRPDPPACTAVIARELVGAGRAPPRSGQGGQRRRRRSRPGRPSAIRPSPALPRNAPLATAAGPPRRCSSRHTSRCAGSRSGRPEALIACSVASVFRGQVEETSVSACSRLVATSSFTPARLGRGDHVQVLLHALPDLVGRDQQQAFPRRRTPAASAPGSV